MSDNLQGGVKVGASSVSLTTVLRSSSTSAETTGKLATDMTLSYVRQGGVRVAVTASDLAAVNSVFSAGGVKEIDATNMPGTYRIDWPDAAFVSGADWVQFAVKVAGCFVFHERIPITSNVILSGDPTSNVAAIKAKTDNLPASPAATSDIPSASTVASAVMGSTVEGGITLLGAMRLKLSALVGKASGMATTSVAFRDIADSKNRIAATVDSNGNRTAVTLDAS